MIFMGWMMSKGGWLNSEGKKFLNKFIINISVPAATVTNFFQTLPKEMLSSMLKFILISSISIFVMIFSAEVIVRILKIEKRKSGIFVALSSTSNCLFFGMPVALGLFGEVGIPFILIYYITDTIIFWSFVTPRMMKDGGIVSKNIFERMKNVLNAPFLTLIFCTALLYLDFSPPSAVLQVSKYLGNVATPMAAIFIGRIIFEIDFKSYRMDIDVIIAVLMRFVAAPFLMFLVTRFFNLDVLATQVLVIMSAMPAKVQTSLVSELYGTDSKFAAFTISATTVLGLFFIPVYMVILNAVL
jgi:predicted permease